MCRPQQGVAGQAKLRTKSILVHFGLKKITISGNSFNAFLENRLTKMLRGEQSQLFDGTFVLVCPSANIH